MNAYYKRSSLPNLPAGLSSLDSPWRPADEVFLEKLQRPSPRRRRASAAAILHFVSRSGSATLADLQVEHVLGTAAVNAKVTPLIKDLQLLREEEEATPEPITHHSYSVAKNLLEYVHAILGSIPHPHLAPDGIGGVRMEWFRDRTNVRVVIPPQEEQRMYIYIYVDGASQIRELSNAGLVNILRSHILMV